jgi:hypothetical protein
MIVGDILCCLWARTFGTADTSVDPHGGRVPTRAAVLGFISSQLGEQNAQIVLTKDIAAMAAIESTIDGLGQINEPARAAALIATLLVKVDSDTVRSELGDDTAQIVSHLMTSPNHMSRLAHLGRLASRGDFVVAPAALAALIGDAVAASTVADARNICEVLEIVAKESASESVRSIVKRSLPNLRKRFSSLETRPSHFTTLISMSIDMSGSTEAKRRMAELAADDRWRLKLYERLYRDFLFAEDRFYRTLFSPTTP